MGYFYFDESIDEVHGFIVGALVYSNIDLQEDIDNALLLAGARPGIDEYKHGARISKSPYKEALREEFFSLIGRNRFALLIASLEERRDLGLRLLELVEQVTQHNEFDQRAHVLYIDEGISVGKVCLVVPHSESPINVALYEGQDSKSIGGLQLADFVAGCAKRMLMEQLSPDRFLEVDREGLVPDNNLRDVRTSPARRFELFGALRNSFLNTGKTALDVEDPGWEPLVIVGRAGLLISDLCSPEVAAAARQEFGSLWFGCLH